MNDAILLCRSLSESFQLLTTRIWPNIYSHRWAGDGFTHIPMQKVSERLCDIITLRTTHELLVNLLTYEENNDLNSLKGLDCFKPFFCLVFSPEAEGQWKVYI